MSPKEKHIPDDAQRTSVCLTVEDKAAIQWISGSRKRKGDKRITLNDVLVDALWHFLEKEYGRTREQIQASVPPPIPKLKSRVTQMPNKKR